MSDYNERICFEVRALHDQVDEIYESFFTETGEVKEQSDTFSQQDKLLELRTKIDDFLSILTQ